MFIFYFTIKTCSLTNHYLPTCERLHRDTGRVAYFLFFQTKPKRPTTLLLVQFNSIFASHRLHRTDALVFKMIVFLQQKITYVSISWPLNGGEYNKFYFSLFIFGWSIIKSVSTRNLKFHLTV